MEIIKELKKEYKNEDYFFYYSKSRPLYALGLEKQNGFIWDKNPQIFIAFEELKKEIINDLELKEISFKYSEFNERQLFFNLNKLFDYLCLDLNKLKNKYKVTDKHIYSLFNNKFNTSRELEHHAIYIYKKYMD